MKKNAMLKIAAILMVAVLLTTCAISSTFAKYVTAYDDVASTEARVAKWGLTITADSDTLELFDDNYGDAIGLNGESPALIVAPGTEYEVENALSFTIGGTPEVNYQLNAFVDVTLEGWTADGFYCPLVFILGEGDDAVEVTSEGCADADAFELKIEEAIAKAMIGADAVENTVATPGDLKENTDAKVYKATYAANKAVPASLSDGITLGWEWAFEVNDTKDTILGNVAAENPENAATVQIDFKVGAEQVNVQ